MTERVAAELFTCVPCPPEQFSFCLLLYTMDKIVYVEIKHSISYYKGGGALAKWWRCLLTLAWSSRAGSQNTGNSAVTWIRNIGLCCLGARTLTLLFCGFEWRAASVNSWLQDPIVCSQSPAGLFPLNASSATSLPQPPRTEVVRGGMFRFPCSVVCLPLTPLSRTCREFLLSKDAYQKQFGRA